MNHLTRTATLLSPRQSHLFLRPCLYTLNQLRFGTDKAGESERFDIKIDSFDTSKKPIPRVTENNTNTINTAETQASTSQLNAQFSANQRSRASGDSFGNYQYETEQQGRYNPSTLFGIKRTTFRGIVLSIACVIGGILFFKLRPTPISENTNRRNMHFFAKLNADPNIVVTYSGLMYRILEDPNGNSNNNNNNNNNETEDENNTNNITTQNLDTISSPNLDQHSVQIHYQGRMLDGKIFDSSFNNGSDAPVFPAKSLIKGLHQGIAKMTRGSTYEFFIPPHLAYGESGSKFISGHEPLVFVVKLIDFWKDQDVYKREEKKILAL